MFGCVREDFGRRKGGRNSMHNSCIVCACGHHHNGCGRRRSVTASARDGVTAPSTMVERRVVAAARAATRCSRSHTCGNGSRSSAGATCGTAGLHTCHGHVAAACTGVVVMQPAGAAAAHDGAPLCALRRHAGASVCWLFGSRRMCDAAGERAAGGGGGCGVRRGRAQWWWRRCESVCISG